MLSKEEVRDYFDKELSHEIKKDNIKIATCRTIMIVSAISCMAFLISAIPLMIITWLDAGTIITLTLFGTFFLVLIITFLCYITVIEKIKGKIIKPVLYKTFEGDKVVYDEKRHLGKREFSKTAFSPWYSYRVEGEDYFELETKVDDRLVRIQMSDISLVTTKTYSDGGAKEEIVESGIFGIIYFDQEVKTEILGNCTLPKFEKINLESEEFNKDFKCYTKDQIEARKVLTPRMMARLLKLQREVDDIPRFHLVGNKLYFMVSKNLFRYKIKGVIDFGEVEQIYDQVYIIYQIATEMAKNKKIFK